MLTDLAAGRGHTVRETPQSTLLVRCMDTSMGLWNIHCLNKSCTRYAKTLSLLSLAIITSSHGSDLPSHLLQVKGHFKSYFSTRFSDQSLWVLLNALIVAAYIPQGLNLTFEPQFSRSFNLPIAPRGDGTYIKAVRRSKWGFQTSYPHLHVYSYSKSCVFELPGCENHFWPDVTVNKESWFRPSIVLQRAHHPVGYDHQMRPSI